MRRSCLALGPRLRNIEPCVEIKRVFVLYDASGFLRMPRKSTLKCSLKVQDTLPLQTTFIIILRSAFTVGHHYHCKGTSDWTPLPTLGLVLYCTSLRLCSQHAWRVVQAPAEAEDRRAWCITLREPTDSLWWWMAWLWSAFYTYTIYITLSSGVWQGCRAHTLSLGPGTCTHTHTTTQHAHSHSHICMPVCVHMYLPECIDKKRGWK